MAKKRCTYCLTPLRADNETSDHVFAASWYPSTTPPNVEKWQVPACYDCNNKYSKLEDHGRTRLALCVDPESPAAAGIVQAALRSLDAAAGKNIDDARVRGLRGDAVRRETIGVDDPTAPGVLPGLDRNFELGSRDGILIPKADLESIVRKWVRGLHYYHLGQLIEDTAEIEMFHVREDSDAAKMFASVERYGTKLDRGPGIGVTRLLGEDDEVARALYAINIWQSYRVYVHVLRRKRV